MPQNTPPLDPASPATTIAGADGTRTIGEIVAQGPGNPLLKLGKQGIKDAGKRIAQIRGLKPGSSSIRTVEMVEEILTRLRDGESMTSIHCDTHICAPRTLDNWRDNDPDLDSAIVRAEARGQRALADIRLNVSQQGEFSSGDPRYDEMFIRAINANIAQRNRAEFGEHRQVDVSHTNAPVMLAPIPNLPSIDADFTVDDDGD